VPVSAEDSGLNRLIEELSNANPATRARAAAEIFRRSFELVHAAVALWLLDTQLASCLHLSETGAPKATAGIAVERATFDRIRAANGSPRLANVPDDQDAEEFELDFPGGARLDILTTKQAGAGGAIDKFLRKFGEGIQQVEFGTSDVDQATETLRAHFGIVPIYPQTRAGADGTRVNFFLVPAAGRKLLIELVETPSSLHES
jgi:hypothetical protein